MRELKKKWAYTVVEEARMTAAYHLCVLWLLGAILCSNGSKQQCANTEQDSHCDASKMKMPVFPMNPGGK